MIEVTMKVNKNEIFTLYNLLKELDVTIRSIYRKYSVPISYFALIDAYTFDLSNPITITLLNTDSESESVFNKKIEEFKIYHPR